MRKGESDTILTIDGDRGSNIAYCGHVFTEPELQPDGSLTFYQVVLTCENEDFAGWAGEETIVPDTATVTTVRLVPTENGWRVDALELPELELVGAGHARPAAFPQMTVYLTAAGRTCAAPTEQ